MLIQPTSTPAKFTADLASKTAATAVPSASTDGIAVNSMRAGLKVHVGAVVTRSSGDAAVTLALYGYVADLGKWFRLELFSEMTETGVDFNHCIQVEVGSAFSRLATRVTAISGTGASVDTYIGLSSAL
jgi:hypothetical protein